MMATALRNYLVVTGGYWAFTLTDGAIRMLVVLYFHQLGYSPFEVAMLFLFYELFGIVTNLVGGWLGARLGLNVTMQLGMAWQIIALLALTVPTAWLSVPYVMAAQALSGIAKDLNKMSAKGSLKSVVANDQDGSLFKWVALLTGSKNTLKGIGFFLGAVLLQLAEFRGAMLLLAAALTLTLICMLWLLPHELGKLKNKPKFSQVFSRVEAINWLSGARFFLFGSRDAWFVVGLPVYLHEVLQWSFTQVGSFMALWVIGYGIVQASTPKILRPNPSGRNALTWVAVLSIIPASIALALQTPYSPTIIVVAGLVAFGIIFAFNSAIHSYLVLAYSDHDKVAMNVGFYYMSNAGGRLVGTIVSGWAYQTQGLIGCLYWSTGFLVIATLLSLKLPKTAS